VRRAFLTLLESASGEHVEDRW